MAFEGYPAPGRPIWPSEQTFESYARSVDLLRSDVRPELLPEIEKRLLQDIPEELFRFPTPLDEKYAANYLEDTQSFQQILSDIKQRLRQVINFGQVSHQAAITEKRSSNQDKIDLEYADALASLQDAWARALAWRRTVERRPENLADRVDSLQSEFDDISRHLISEVRVETDALRGASSGAVKLMLTMSAAMSAVLATMLAALPFVTAPFAWMAGVGFFAAILSVGMGLGYALHQRSTLAKQLERWKTERRNVEDHAVVAGRVSQGEQTALAWTKWQGGLLLLQLLAFSVALVIYLVTAVQVGARVNGTG